MGSLVAGLAFGVSVLAISTGVGYALVRIRRSQRPEGWLGPWPPRRPLTQRIKAVFRRVPDIEVEPAPTDAASLIRQGVVLRATDRDGLAPVTVFSDRGDDSPFAPIGPADREEIANNREAIAAADRERRAKEEAEVFGKSRADAAKRLKELGMPVRSAEDFEHAESVEEEMRHERRVAEAIVYGRPMPSASKVRAVAIDRATLGLERAKRNFNDTIGLRRVEVAGNRQPVEIPDSTFVSLSEALSETPSRGHGYVSDDHACRPSHTDSHRSHDHGSSDLGSSNSSTPDTSSPSETSSNCSTGD